MLTLSANLLAYLEKTSNPELVYIVKLSAQHGSTYASTAFYFGDKEMTVTDSTAQRVRGILLNNSIDIIQSVDLKAHKATYGGFSLQLADAQVNPFSDELNTYRIYNRAIEIYIGNPDEGTLSNYLKLYAGIAKDWTINGGIITINIENDTSVVQKDLPKNFYPSDDSTYQSQPETVKSLRIPFVYGDRPFYYGNDNGATSLTNIANVASQTNNMTKAFFIGIDVDGDSVYLVSAHALHTDDEAFYRAWMYDSSLGRYVMIKSTDTVFTTDGNGYVVVKVNNLPNVYDFWFPDGTISSKTVTGAGNWSNETDSCNKVWTDNSLSSYASDIVSLARYTVDFSPYDGYQDDANIQSVEVYGKVDYDTSDAADFTCLCNSTDLQSFDESQLNNIDTAPATKAGVSEALQFIHDVDTEGVNHSDCKVYMVYKAIEYTVTEMFDVYVACKGRAADATLAGYFDDLSNGDLIEHPAHVIPSILYSELGLTDSNIDTTAFDTAYDDLTSAYKLAFSIYDKIDSKDLIDKISLSSKLVTFFNANNVVTTIYFDKSFTTDKTLQLNDLVGLPTISYSKLSDIVNLFDFNYNQSPKGGLQGIIQREDDRANVGSQAVYDAEMYKSMSSSYISDATTAGLLADLWCKDDADSFWSVLHHVIEFETPDLRGGGALYDTGTFEPLIRLELLDTIELDDADFDTLLKCNGVSWSGLQFIITSITRTRSNLKIKAISV